MSLSIDIVIPTHGRFDLTERCLEHLREQTVPHSVFVIDNGSPDGTPDKVRESFAEVQVLELGANLGFPIACNRGAALGSGEVIVLLNNDVEARPDFLEKLVVPMVEDPGVGSVAPLLLRPDERTIDCVGLTADRTLAGFPRLAGRPAIDASSLWPTLSGASGAAGGYRRSAWEQVGGLDEGVLFYGEDLDLALRIRAAGWTAASVPEAVGIHLGSATAGDRSPAQRFQAGFARAYFLRRYRVLSTRYAPRMLVTEVLVAIGDAVLSRDANAFRGRMAGWHAAGSQVPRAMPPEDATDRSIGFVQSIRLRVGIYRVERD